MFRPSRIVTIALVALCASGLVLGVAAPASAAARYPTLADANIRSGPNTSSSVVEVVPKGARISIDCYTEGQQVGNTTIWDHTQAGWVSDALVLTGSDSPVIPECSTATAQSGQYDRAAAVAWAITDAYVPPTFNDDCTFFVSQALWAGGLPETSDWTANSWNFFDLAQRSRGLSSPSKAAADADYFKNAMENDGYGTLTEIDPSDPTAGGAQLGDVILYDWNNGADGIVDHAAIVTKISADGTVGITQHSPARDYRKWNVDGNGKQLTDLRAYLLHITY
jgi:uncharacterized protein YraI